MRAWVVASQTQLATPDLRCCSALHVRCGGQALVEAMLGLGVMIVLAWAVIGLGRRFDLVQQLAHASRHAVFIEATQASDEVQTQNWLREFWLTGAEQRWPAPQGGSVLVAGSERWQDAKASLPAEAQPGGTQFDARRLRPQWDLQDRGLVWRGAQVSLRDWRLWAPGDHEKGAGVAALAGTTLMRHTTLVAGTGHTADDEETSRRLEQGQLGWAAAANRSRALGQDLTRMLTPLERGWGRPMPRWDWVRSWQGERPTLGQEEFGGGAGW